MAREILVPPTKDQTLAPCMEGWNLATEALTPEKSLEFSLINEGELLFVNAGIHLCVELFVRIIFLFKP